MMGTWGYASCALLAMDPSYSFLDANMVLTASSHALKSPPHPPNLLILRVDLSPSVLVLPSIPRYFILSAFRLRLIPWWVIHHQMMLSLEKNTFENRSWHPGLQGSPNRKRRRKVRRIRRGRYSASGGSSPVDGIELTSPDDRLRRELHIHMMSVDASNPTLPPRLA